MNAGIVSALKDGYIVRHKAGNSFAYELVVKEIDQSSNPTDIGQVSRPIDAQNGQVSRHTKENKIKETIKEIAHIYEPVDSEGNPIPPKRPTKKQRDAIPEKVFKPMAIAIGEVMGWDMKIRSNWEALGRKARELILAGYTAEIIQDTYGPGGTWYRQDWRGRKGQHPNIADITKTVGELSGKTGAQSTPSWMSNEERARKGT